MFGLLIVCGAVGALFGFLGLTQANGAVQEIEGLIGVLIVTVAIAGFYVGSVLDGQKKAAAAAPFVPPFPPPPAR